MNDQPYWLAEFLQEMENQLAPAEQEYANAMLAIADKYGKLADGDANGIWVGYVAAQDNDNLAIGVKCSNCFFYDQEYNDEAATAGCQIVAQAIEPDGYCRLAAIPPGLVKR